MVKRLLALTVLMWTIGTGIGRAQQCLHNEGETQEQAARRSDALTATRMINNLEWNAPGRNDAKFLHQEELMTSPFFLQMQASTNLVVKRISLLPGTDILPGWQLTLGVTERGYWFKVTDKTDPCNFAYISNDAGTIFRAEPIR